MNNNYSCIIVDDEPLAIELLTEQLSLLFKNIQIIATCTNWKNALSTIQTTHCDLLFMDISMPGKNSIDMLKLVPTLDREIIFITAHEEYAIDAHNFNVSGYLLKPVSDVDLSHAIHRALARIQNMRAARSNGKQVTSNSDKIGIPNKYGIDYVNIADILYLESINKCTKVVTATKDYLSLSPLIKFKVFADTHSFIQVHRSFVININYILRYESSGIVTMSNKHEVPVARTYRNELLKTFGNTF